MVAQRISVQKPSQVVIEEFTPPSPQAGEVLIQTRTSLVSPGTERAFYLALPNTNANYPLYPGYSNIGKVIALGTGVEGLQVGDRVASTTPHASQVVAPAAKCVLVPAGLSDDEAAFFNLIAIAMQGVHKARIELGEKVLVIGAGMIGLFAMQLARQSGGLPVLIVDQDAQRLQIAQTLGADVTAPPDAPDLPNSAAVVIEATGAAAAVVLAFQSAAPRGRVILLGSSRGETDGVNFYRDVHRKGISIIGAHEITRPQYEDSPGWWTQTAEHRIALELLARGRLQVQPLITHHFNWQDFSHAYDLLASWDSLAMGMVIHWDTP